MKLKIAVLLICLLGFALPAQAKITLGAVPSDSALFSSESQVNRFAVTLGQLLGEDVRVRLFSDEAVLNEWLSRYRQVDLAVLSRAYLEQRPAGEFTLIAAYFRTGQPGLSTDLIVARQGANVALMEQIQGILLGMEGDATTLRILREIRVTRFVPPGTPPPAPEPNLVVGAKPVAVAKEKDPAPRSSADQGGSAQGTVNNGLRPDEDPAITDQRHVPPPPVPSKTRISEKLKEPPPSKEKPAESRQTAPLEKAERDTKAKPEPPVSIQPKTPLVNPPEKETTPEEETGGTPVLARDEGGFPESEEPAPQKAFGGTFYLFALLLLAALIAAAGYMLWQLRRLNNIMGGISEQWQLEENPSAPSKEKGEGPSD